MKPRWTCRCTRAEERIIKPTYGSTVDPEERWCLTSVWAWTGWTETVPGTVRGTSADGRLCGLRSDRRTEDGACGLLVACRTIFSEAVQLNPKDPVATPIVARIDELFAIDAEARSPGLSLEHAMFCVRTIAIATEWDSETDRSSPLHSTARGCARQSLQLHAHALGKTHPFSGISGTGVE